MKQYLCYIDVIYLRTVYNSCTCRPIFFRDSIRRSRGGTLGPICLSTYLPIYPSTHPPIHPSIHPSTHPRMCIVHVKHILGHLGLKSPERRSMSERRPGVERRPLPRQGTWAASSAARRRRAPGRPALPCRSPPPGALRPRRRRPSARRVPRFGSRALRGRHPSQDLCRPKPPSLCRTPMKRVAAPYAGKILRLGQQTAYSVNGLY